MGDTCPLCLLDREDDDDCEPEPICQCGKDDLALALKIAKARSLDLETKVRGAKELLVVVLVFGLLMLGAFCSAGSP